jgi:hypothetical protein
MKNCGNCRWLDAPSEDIRKDGNVKERYRFRVYHCRVPFTRPTIPSCVRVEWRDDPSWRLMCPSYGEDCTFHEQRKAFVERMIGMPEEHRQT